MMLTLYRTLTTLGGPLIQYYLKRRMAAGKKIHPGARNGGAKVYIVGPKAC